MRFAKFLGSNWSYILWFIIYFCIAWGLLVLITEDTLNSFMIVLAIYGVSVTTALCPMGEFILRATEGCRQPQTEQERNYLLPMFEEVYQNAKEKNPKLKKGITLYIMDAMYVNAFAMGRKTIAVTRGAMESFTADELKGILAHELGHITHGHTKALLLAVIGNLFFSIIVWAFRVLLQIIQFISNVVAHINVVGLVLSFITFVTRIYVNVLIFIFVNLSEIILALNSRTNEIQADSFAHEIGYGRELISGLYLLQKISMDTKVPLMEKMKATHSHTAYRISHLEGLENRAWNR